MSLRVWLPLTKDLRNQGLDDVTVTNNGATFDSAGKLGGCYSFDGSGCISCSSHTWTYPISICAWFKPTDVTNSSTQYWLSYNTASGGTAGHAIGIGTYGGKLSVWFGGQVRLLSTPLSNNVWYHIAFTIDANKKATTYLNGEQIDTTTFTANNPGSTWFTIGARSNSSTGGAGGALYFYKGYMNDARLYDHCLSPMEVKELAKGLVLHYPLNRGGWGQENLVDNSDFSNLATSGYVIKDTTVLFHGKPTCKINRTGATSNTYTGWTSQNLFSRLTPGSKVTVSVWVYRDSNHGIDSGCEWRMYQRYNDNASTDWTGFYSAANWPIGEWKQFKYTYTVRNDISSAYLSFNVIKNGTYWLAEPKVEIGEVVTPWCPSSSDTLYAAMGLNGTTEYDCSGYCNNLNKNGTYSYTSDTPKYAVSTKFNGTEWMNGSTPGAEIKTLACWAKTTKNKSTSQFMVADSTSNMCISFYSGCIIGVFGTTRSTGSRCTLGSSYKENDWNHFVVVKTGDNGERSIYCNGEPLVATSNDYWGSAAGLFIGSRNNSATLPFYGQICDVRAYATALSPTDVLSLYQNCATIDADGTIRGQIRS